MHTARTIGPLMKAMSKCGVVVMALAVSTSSFGQGQRPLAKASPEVQQRAMRQIADLEVRKSLRTVTEQKVDSVLLDQLAISQGRPLTPSLKSYQTGIEVGRDGKVTIELTATVSGQLLNRLRFLGGDILDVVPDFGSILLRAPLAEIIDIASLADVEHVARAPIALTSTITSEGDKTHRANLARSTYGLSGKGVKVGVLSDSVRYLEQAQSDGELPSDVQVLTNQSGVSTGDHGEGTAMLEIIHDLAPNAKLAFATALTTEARFAQNILDLKTAGCKVIVDDVGYIAEDAFQDDVVARAVNTVTSQGVQFYSAAGNDGRLSDNTSGVWEGDFVSGGTTSFGTIHSFGSTSLNAVASSSVFSLQWSDPHGASINDYDLYVTDSNGNIAFVSDTTQNGHSDPFEEIALSGNLVNGYLAVVRKSGAARYLRLQAHRGTLAVATAGSTYGHSCAVNATNVAAVDAMASYPHAFSPASALETYSSDGPRKIFYNANGTAITPGNLLATGGTNRRKPDLTAADDVQTSVIGFQPFQGTSAAAPHAAAIAALMLEVNPTTTINPATFRSTYLEGAAWTSTDPASGGGIINAFDSVGRFIVANTPLKASVTRLAGGRSCIGSLSVTGAHAVPADLVYNLSCNDDGVTVPATVTIPAGSTHGDFTITNVASTATSAVITATLDGTSYATSLTLSLSTPLLKGIRLSPATVVGGNTVSATITLNRTAVGPVDIDLHSSVPGVLQAPATVTIPNGANILVVVCPVSGVDANTAVSLTASIGAVTVTASANVVPATISTFTASPTSVYGGSSTTVTGVVTLKGAAGPAGVVVDLSSNMASASVPATVTVPPNEKTVSFTITHHLVAAASTPTITAATGDVSRTLKLSIKPILPVGMLMAASVYGGNPVTGTVTLNTESPVGGLSVTLHSNSANATVPGSIVVPAGQKTATFTVTTSNVAANQTVTFSATGNGRTVSKALILRPYIVSALSVSPASVTGGSGTAVTLTITLVAPVPAGGSYTVALASSVPTVAGVPPSCTFAAGEVTKTVSVSHVAVRATKPVGLTASLNGVTRKVVLTVNH